MPTDQITIRGAREHNLKNVTLSIPRDKLVVFTGLSGSGKSSLAFDTIYAEGQRRYVESLSAYARQFLGQMEKPDVDAIEGLSPAIAIEQRGAGSNPRSTVATITEAEPGRRFTFECSMYDFHFSTWGYRIEPTDTGSRVTEWNDDLRPESTLEFSAKVSGIADRAERNRQTISGTLERLAAALER